MISESFRKLYTPHEANAIFNKCKIALDPIHYSLSEKLITDIAECDIWELCACQHEMLTERNLAYKLRMTTETRDNKYVTDTESSSAAVGIVKLNNVYVNLCNVISGSKLSKFKGSSLERAIYKLVILLIKKDSGIKNIIIDAFADSDTMYMGLTNALGTYMRKEKIILMHINNGRHLLKEPSEVFGTFETCSALVFYNAYKQLSEIEQNAIAEFDGPNKFFKVVDGVYYPNDIIEPYTHHEINEACKLNYKVPKLHESSDIKPNSLLGTFFEFMYSTSYFMYRKDVVQELLASAKEKGITLDSPSHDKVPETESALFETSTDTSSTASSTPGHKSRTDPFSRYLPEKGVGMSMPSSEPSATTTFAELDKDSASYKSGGYTITVKNCAKVYNDRTVSNYNSIASAATLLNKELIRKLRNIKTYNTGGKNTGETKGKLDTKRLYRHSFDNAICFNNTYKQLESDLAIGILLDESGSMHGSGIENGRATMVVLHETLLALGINHCIMGHTVHGSSKHHCDLERYVSFKESPLHKTGKCYALANMSAMSGNCDSGALYVMEQEFQRVRNKDKICIMFSDGAPTECTGTELIAQVKHMERAGIKVIGVGINFPSIADYYTDYANGKNLRDMFNIVTRILEEYILKKKV